MVANQDNFWISKDDFNTLFESVLLCITAPARWCRRTIRLACGANLAGGSSNFESFSLNPFATFVSASTTEVTVLLSLVRKITAAADALQKLQCGALSTGALDPSHFVSEPVGITVFKREESSQNMNKLLDKDEIVVTSGHFTSLGQAMCTFQMQQGVSYRIVPSTYAPGIECVFNLDILSQDLITYAAPDVLELMSRPKMPSLDKPLNMDFENMPEWVSVASDEHCVGVRQSYQSNQVSAQQDPPVKRLAEAINNLPGNQQFAQLHRGLSTVVGGGNHASIVEGLISKWQAKHPAGSANLDHSDHDHLLPSDIDASTVSWLKASEIYGVSVPLFGADSEAPSLQGVRPGTLSNNSLLFAMHVIATSPDLIKRLFLDDEHEAEGLVVVQLFIDGIWKPCVVDDKLPCHKDNLLQSLSSSSAEGGWVAIIEKAFAQLSAGYQTSDCFSVAAALQVLTGGVVYDVMPSQFQLALSLESAAGHSFLTGLVLSEESAAGVPWRLDAAAESNLQLAGWQSADDESSLMQKQLPRNALHESVLEMYLCHVQPPDWRSVRWRSCWTAGKCAGGHHGRSTWGTNPHLRVQTSAASSLRITLTQSGDAAENAIGFLLYKSDTGAPLDPVPASAVVCLSVGGTQDNGKTAVYGNASEVSSCCRLEPNVAHFLVPAIFDPNPPTPVDFVVTLTSAVLLQLDPAPVVSGSVRGLEQPESATGAQNETDNATLEFIAADCKRTSQSAVIEGEFEDTHFPPCASSLYRYPGKLTNRQVAPNAVHWQRCKGGLQVKQLFCHDAPLEISQGRVADNWILSAMTMLWCVDPSMITDLFEHCNEEAGMYTVRLFVHGVWTSVTIDDWIPYLTSGCPIYARSMKEWWPMLLEKAFAKVYGSYDALQGGMVQDALRHLTGGIADTRPLKTNPDSASAHNVIKPLTTVPNELEEPWSTVR